MSKPSRTLLLLLLVYFPLTTFAQQRNFSISKTLPAWIQKVTTVDKRPANRDIQDGYFIFLYEQQANLENEEQYVHVIREIVSDNGVQNGSEISVTYDPSYEKLTFHQVTIWRNNKPINKLNARNFKVMQNEKELTKFIYSGTYDAYLILDDVRKGDRIEYAFSKKGANPVFGKQFCDTYYFDDQSQIANIYFNVIAKKERAIQFKNFNAVPKLNTKEINGLKVYEWQGQLTKAIKSEEFEPSWYNSYSRVQISEFKSWKEIVDWSIKLNSYDLGKSATLNSKIKDFKQKANGNKEKYFELVTRFVQDEVRYMGIEMGEYSHRPNSPEKVLRQRYGDCKDKSLLLIALLKGNDINAYPVYINTYLNDKTKALLPTTEAFNHAVVLVEFEGQKIWIDPTIADQGGPIKKTYFPYHANVLVVKPGNDKLEWVKPNPPGKLSSTTIFNLPDTTEGKKAEITIKSTYTANYADDIRNYISSSGIDKIEKDYLAYYTKIYPTIAKTKDIVITDDRKNNVVFLEEYYDIENSWAKDDSVSSKFYANFYGDMVNNELRTLKKARKIPFSLKYPANVHQIVKILIPTSSDIKPKEIEIDRAGYQFNYKLFYSSDTLVLDYKYVNKTYEIPGEETKQYVTDREKIYDYINYSISWDGSPVNKQTSDVNFSMVLLAIIVFFCSIIAGFFVYVYKQPYNLEEIKIAPKIGGWLILVAIGLIISLLMLIRAVYFSNAFSKSAWDNLSSYTPDLALLWKWIFVLEVGTNMSILAGIILLLVLFFGRRKILPRFYVIFKTITLLILIIDLIIVNIISDGVTKFTLIADLTNLLTKLIFSIIWIIYFLKSSRVKQTFVFTYPNVAWRFALIKDMSAHINVPFPSDLNQAPVSEINSIALKPNPDEEHPQ
jgi:hypothetical protein